MKPLAQWLVFLLLLGVLTLEVVVALSGSPQGWGLLIALGGVIDSVVYLFWRCSPFQKDVTRSLPRILSPTP